MGYCNTMIESIKIYVEDKYWNRIFTDLGAVIVDSPKNADVVFDESEITTPISLSELQNFIISRANNNDIIVKVFGKDIVLPTLQHKIVVALYKNPGINLPELKMLLGVSPEIASHTVENAIYQLRKVYGHDFIVNDKGKYKVGKL